MVTWNEETLASHVATEVRNLLSGLRWINDSCDAGDLFFQQPRHRQVSVKIDGDSQSIALYSAPSDPTFGSILWP